MSLHVTVSAMHKNIPVHPYKFCPSAMCSFSRENVDLAAALLTLACLGEGKEVSWTHEPQLKALLGQHSIREASR